MQVSQESGLHNGHFSTSQKYPVALMPWKGVLESTIGDGRKYE